MCFIYCYSEVANSQNYSQDGMYLDHIGIDEINVQTENSNIYDHIHTKEKNEAKKSEDENNYG